jgi:hypothetical protein
MGNIGTGKTLLAELLFKKYIYDKIELNSTDFRSQKKLSDFLRKTLCFKNVMDLFCGETKPIGLLMDEIEVFSFIIIYPISTISSALEASIIYYTPKC